MSNVNDSKILELKKQIELKKAKLLELGKISFFTNLSLEFEGERYNLNV